MNSLPSPVLDSLRASTRRRFLQQCGTGMGALALGSLLNDKLLAADSGLPTLGKPHFAPKAKNIIYLFQSGGPSHLDLFDPKPELQKRNGQQVPEELVKNIRLAQIGKEAKLLASPYKFAQYGKSGMWLSELMPHLQTIVDDVCFVQGFHSEAFNHDPATIFMNTGAQLAGRPGMGSWFSYGLGSENKDLPAFVVLMTGVGQPLTNAAWGSGFLPTMHQGVTLRSQGDAVLFVSNPAGIDAKRRRQSLDALKDLNQMRYDVLRDPEIETRINSYELAYRMQTSVPEVMDISKETAKTHEAYGTSPGRASFANNCLLARRLVERGVRFVQLFDWGWDQHSGLDTEFPKKCKQIDQPAAALLADLKERGLLDETLVVWGGEFGRTPMQENRGGVKASSPGRDHHPGCFTMWLAGGGVKGGFEYGTTDELGFSAVENPVQFNDLHATILHLLGLNHEKLTYPISGGLNTRLTTVIKPSRVVKEIFA